ncbi:MAG: head GIN domain-containing protein [Pseudomonadota bacterium]
MSAESRHVDKFDRVRFRGPGILKIVQGESESLQVQAPAYLLPDIESQVEAGELRLGVRARKIISLRVHREVISYTLTVRELNALKSSGLGRVLIPDIDNDRFRLELSGMGHVILEQLTADRLDVLISGAGTIHVKGDVEAQAIRISGAGHYKAQELVSDFASVEISGAGAADITVSEDLDVAISGAGHVTYAGYPELVKRISGAGSVSRRRRTGRVPVNGEDHG